MNIRVLIFEDEEMVRKLFIRLLQKKGYEIYDFEDPISCPLYEKAECNCPLNKMCADIIITDIKMPHTNGLKFVKEQKEKNCKVKNIVVISGLVTPDLKEDIEKLGYKCLRKPFDTSELFNILDEFEKNIDPDRELIDWDEIASQ